jgi:hypothetical protein
MDFLKKKMKELLDDDDKPKDKPTGELLYSWMQLKSRLTKVRLFLKFTTISW